MKRRLLQCLVLCIIPLISVSQWSTPILVDSSFYYASNLHLAMGPQRKIAAACSYGNWFNTIESYTSADLGESFSRKRVASSTHMPLYDIIVGGPDAIAFDNTAILYVMFSTVLFDLTSLGTTFIISSSTVTDTTFVARWVSPQGWGTSSSMLLRNRLAIGADNTIQMFWDSGGSSPPYHHLTYTRFFGGSFSNRRDVFVNPELNVPTHSGEVAFLTKHSAVHYSFRPSPNDRRLFYGLSVDSGSTFLPSVVVDSLYSVSPEIEVASNGQSLVLYAKGNDSSAYGDKRLFVRTLSDTCIDVSSPLALPVRMIAYGSRIRFNASSSRNYLVYTTSGPTVAWYEFNDISQPPIDSVFFNGWVEADFALDSLGGKYLLATDASRHHVYFVRKDVVLDVATPLKLPIASALGQNYPNPFNPATSIRYELGHGSHVSLRVFDLLGRLVTTLVNQQQNAGEHVVTFDGSSLSSGVYFCRLEAGGFSRTKRLMLLR